MRFPLLPLLALLSLISPAALADDALPQDAGNMVWLVCASALVFLMQAGFCALEAG